MPYRIKHTEGDIKPFFSIYLFGFLELAFLLLRCFQPFPPCIYQVDRYTLLYWVYKQGLFSTFPCSLLGQSVGKLCCYPSSWRCLKVVSGRLQTICRNSDAVVWKKMWQSTCVGEASEREIEAVFICIGHGQAVQKLCKSSTKHKNCPIFSSLPWFLPKTVAICGSLIEANLCLLEKVLVSDMP